MRPVGRRPQEASGGGHHAGLADLHGFLVNRLGELSWHGWSDLLRLVVLALIGSIGVALGAGLDGLRE